MANKTQDLRKTMRCKTKVREKAEHTSKYVSISNELLTQQRAFCVSPVEVFTDGACRGNPGPGGWGVLLRYNNQEKFLYGAEEHTTNNRMELMAAIQALAALKRTCHVVLTTDSEYVKKGITEWVTNWQKRNWRTADKKPVKNADLWQQLIQEVSRHQIEWHWVKGHSGHRENEIADQLANQAIDEMLTLKK